MNYEQWRPALIAFLSEDSPWMIQKLKNLKYGAPLTFEDRRMIEGLVLAGERAPKRKKAA